MESVNANDSDVADLQNFKLELMRKLKKVVAEQPVVPQKPWSKSNEVHKLLKISR
jgi:hypothetical protein